MTKKADLKFSSQTYGELRLSGMVSRIESYINEQPDMSHRLIIGTDSLPNAYSGVVYFVSALVIHRIGRGGIYFWCRQKMSKIFELRPRIWQEAWISIELAQQLVEKFNFLSESGKHIEIHVDVGNNGPTRDLIKEIASMVSGHGFNVKMKPDAYAATKIADRHTIQCQ